MRILIVVFFAYGYLVDRIRMRWAEQTAHTDEMRDAKPQETTTDSRNRM
jgi:hypothetical protein